MAQLAETSCLDENTIAELLEGCLSQAELTKVEAHTDRCSQCRRLVADLAADPVVETPTRRLSDDDEAGNTVPLDTAAVDTLPIGAEQAPRILKRNTMVDHFRIGKLIGTGGMGQVYSARDTKLGRKVALKMVLPELVTSDDVLRRFQLEARTTARFSHPNIVTIHFVGAFHGRPYVALEYLRGRTLRDHILDARPKVSRSIAIAGDIARALAEAHRHGVLHRDLKPANVHIGVDGHVRVLDFGLAKIIDSETQPPSSTLIRVDQQLDMLKTHTTGLAGTPNYMAPEQWLAEPCSTATDIWALGIVMFYLFTGKRAFDAHSLDELVMAVCSVGDAPRVEPHVDDVPIEIGDLVAACLRKKAAYRPSVAEILEVLDSYEPVTHSRAISLPPAKDNSRLALGAASVLLVLIGGALAASFARSDKPEVLATGMSGLAPLRVTGLASASASASASTVPLSTSSVAPLETASATESSSLSSSPPRTTATTSASTTRLGNRLPVVPVTSAKTADTAAPVASSDPSNPDFDGTRK